MTRGSAGTGAVVWYLLTGGRAGADTSIRQGRIVLQHFLKENRFVQVFAGPMWRIQTSTSLSQWVTVWLAYVCVCKEVYVGTC